MYSRPTAPLSIGGVIDDAIRIYRESFSLLGAGAAAGAGERRDRPVAVDARAGQFAGRLPSAAMLRVYAQPGVSGLYLVQWVLTAGLYGALFLAQDGATGGSVQSLGEAFGGGFARIGGAILAAILFAIIVAVGFALLLIPGFYFLGALCLWPVALFIDGEGALASFHTSRALTRGHWWRTSAIITVAFIIILVFSMVVGLVGGGLSVVNLRRDPTLALIGIQSVAMVANIFIIPMYSAVLLSIYQTSSCGGRGETWRIGSGRCRRADGVRSPLAWLGCIAILALLIGPARADEDSSPAAVLSQCAIATQRQAVKGMEELRARCPDLERALNSLGLTQQLGESWQKRIDSRALVGLAHLADRFTGAPPAAAPDPVALGAAMQSLQSHDTHPSLWERFKSWLRSWFRSPEERSADNGWLQQWLARIQLPPLLARVVGYLAIALLLGLSLWIVLRELRAAGALQRSPAHDRGAAQAGARAPAAAASLDPTALESLPLWQQPAALLGMLVETLQRSGRLDIRACPDASRAGRARATR